MKIGIMGAMPQEVDLIKSDMQIAKEETLGGRNFVSGKLHGFDTVLVFSRWGKVAAASTATTLFHHYQIDFLLFTGVAGGVNPHLNIGDVVIGAKLYQHDMDATPLFPKFHIPLTNTLTFSPLGSHITMAEQAIEKYLARQHLEIKSAILEQFSIVSPKVTKGIIATGDVFVKNTSTHANLQLNNVESADAVEMEGAAVAQVCEDNQKPYIIIRTISDKANSEAPIDFLAFIENVSNVYSKGIVQEFFALLKNTEHTNCDALPATVKR